MGRNLCLALPLIILAVVAPPRHARADPCTLGEASLEPGFDCSIVPVSGGAHLAVVRAPATEDVTGDPILMLTGGPGFRTVGAIQRLLASPVMRSLRRHHEIVARDPRNVGGSRPVAGCLAIDGNLGPDPLDLAQLSECMLVNTEIFKNDERTARAGDDAQDAVLVRKALGIRRWNVIASSWDSRVAVRLAALDRDATGALLLVAPVAVNGPVYDARYAEQRILVFDRLAADCDGQAECRAVLPAIGTVLDRMLAFLDRTPLPLSLHTAAGRPVPVTVSGSVLADALLGQAYGTSAANIPLLVGAVAMRLDHGLDIPAPLASALFGVNEPPLGQTNTLTFLVQMCRAQEGAEPMGTLQQRYGAKAGLKSAAKYAAACPALHLPPLPPEPDASLPDGLPTLVLMGRYDPQVSEAAAQALVQGRRTARVMMFEALGHEVGLDDCAAQVAAAFLDGPGSLPDASCAEHRLVFRTRPGSQD